MRCVKWWLRQRQLPRTKEGGLPTLAWLLLTVHTCSLPETRKEISDKGPMAALVASLSAFFRGYSDPASLHGVLQFHTELGDDEELLHSSEFTRSATKIDSPWADLVVLDPTQRGEDVNLAPSLSPATQLLVVYELQRAAALLQEQDSLPSTGPSTPRRGTDSTVCSTPRKGSDQVVELNMPEESPSVERIFEGLPPLKNCLPAIATEPLAVLLLQGNPFKGVGSIEVAIIDRIVPRPGWSAPFLHRSDTTSELHARMCDVTESTGSCQPRREGSVVLCPCHFICMLELGRDGSRFKLLQEDLHRFRSMRQILSKLHTHQRALGDLTSYSPQRNPVEKQATPGSRRRGRRGQKKNRDY